MLTIRGPNINAASLRALEASLRALEAALRVTLLALRLLIKVSIWGILFIKEI